MAMRTIISLLFGVNTLVSGQSNPSPYPDWRRLDAKQRLQALTLTPPAYRNEALTLLIGEANRVAHELSLQEKLPIIEPNVISAYISPVPMAEGLKGIGNITTSNYTYYVSIGNKFSGLVLNGLQESYLKLQAEYLLPIAQMDTNAAFQLAKQKLAAVSIDVDALNRDCQLSIRAWTPEGPTGKHFVPVYWVSWGSNGSPVASIELFEPTKAIRQLHINISNYILRKPLQISNAAFLLSQTNSLTLTNAIKAK